MSLRPGETSRQCETACSRGINAMAATQCNGRAISGGRVISGDAGTSRINAEDASGGMLMGGVSVKGSIPVLVVHRHCHAMPSWALAMPVRARDGMGDGTGGGGWNAGRLILRKDRWSRDWHGTC